MIVSFYWRRRQVEKVRSLIYREHREWASFMRPSPEVWHHPYRQIDESIELD